MSEQTVTLRADICGLGTPKQPHFVLIFVELRHLNNCTLALMFEGMRHMNNHTVNHTDDIHVLANEVTQEVCPTGAFGNITPAAYLVW
jgi:hypothetical protein